MVGRILCQQDYMIASLPKSTPKSQYVVIRSGDYDEPEEADARYESLAELFKDHAGEEDYASKINIIDSYWKPVSQPNPQPVAPVVPYDPFNL